MRSPHIAPLFLLATTSLAGTAAHAQSTETASEESVSNEAIVITARRREEQLQDVPLAITAVAGTELERTGTYNVNRLVQLQPSVQFVSSNQRNSAINIRGLGAPFGLTNDGIEQGVGLYIDQVYFGRISAATLDFIDVERIEVLRGPQGTLYGKNTTAGAVSVTTRKPGFDLEGRAELTYGNLDFVQAKSSISGPIVDEKLAARLSTSFTRRDGAVFNVISSRDVNEQVNFGVRGQLLFTPTDRLKLTLAGDYNRQNPEGFAQSFVKVVPTLRAPARQYANLAALSGYVPASTDPFDRLVDNDSELSAKQIHAGASLVAEWDLGAATLTSVSAWRKWDWYPSNDRDFTSLPITTRSENPSRQRQWTQEFRIASNDAGRLEYVVGAFAYHQKIQTDGLQEQGSAASLWLLGPVNGANPALLDGLSSANDISYTNDSIAAYGKLTWNISDRLSIAPGIRINYDKKVGEYNAVVTGGLTPATPAQQALKNGVLQSQSYSARFSDWNLSGDVTLAYEPTDDTLFYLTYAKSFKSGGINLSGIPNRADGTPATEVASVDPEKVDHYEAGFKGQFLDGGATINVAAYRTDVRDYQVTVVNGQIGVIRGYLANAEKVRSQGVEIDLALRPTRNLRAYVNFAYTDAKYISFPDAPPPIELSGGSIQFVDISGGRLPGVSKYAISYGAEYTIPADSLAGSIYLGVDGSLRSEFSSSPSPSQFMNVEGYALTNVRAGFRSDNDWEVFGWVRNAFDTEYFDFLTAAPGSTGLIAGQLGDPRTYGITAKFNF